MASDTAHWQAANGEETQMPVRIVRFEMDEGRILLDRYNLRSIPSCLAYMGGKLAFASTRLTKDFKSSYGDDIEDMLVQVRVW